MKAFRVLALVFALSVCAYAGDMDNGKTSAPPPAPSSTAAPEKDDVPGHIETPTTSESAVTEIVLSLLNSVLSLF